MEEIITKSEKETYEFAEKFAETLKSGDIILLSGDLGAGKTVFSKGIVSKLSNGKEVAVSPTFVIVNTYDCSPPVHHFDLYRINDVSELDSIGAEEYFYSDGICLVEWSERAAEVFPSYAIRVTIEKIDDEKRIIKVER